MEQNRRAEFLQRSAAMSIDERVKQLEETVAQVERKLSATTELDDASGVAVLSANVLVLRDGSGQPRLAAHAGPQNEFLIRLIDGEGRLRAGLGVGPDGEPSLILAAKDGQPRIAVHLDPSDSPELLLLDARGTRRVDLSIDESTAPSLAMLDANGEPQVLVMVGPDGKGAVLSK